MKIAVLSGKGGAGKTLVAVNLAAVAQTAVYADCDVEEPNGHLYFQPHWRETVSVDIRLPQIHAERCIGCRQCVEFCRFHALAMSGSQVLLFPELCHACGGCQLVCPNGAIDEQSHRIGRVRSGDVGNLQIITGLLDVGERSGIPIIHRVLQELPATGTAIIDCPPGSACTVMASIQQADYCLLVAEPTTFGRDNLRMVHELVRVFQKPAGLVLNKVVAAWNPCQEYALQTGLPILGRIAYDRYLAAQQAQGVVVAWKSRKYGDLFSELLQVVRKECGHETGAGGQW